MIIFPAMDLMNGEVVKLESRRHERPERIYGQPGEIADRWLGCGARWLHVVDLNAALGRGMPNHLALLQLLPRVAKAGAKVQWGGGVRDATTLRLLLDAELGHGGKVIDHVVVGTRAVKDWTWLVNAAENDPGRIVVAADAAGRDVLVGGWQEKAGLDLVEFVTKVQELPVAAVQYTNVAVEGRGQGIDWHPVEAVLKIATKPVIISGGIGSLEDLRRLKTMGAWGAIIGSGIYTGQMDLAQAIAAAT